jgi:hypothetical protein
MLSPLDYSFTIMHTITCFTHIFTSTNMAAAETTPGNFVPRVIFPLFIVLGVSAVAYFGLRQCDCDDRNSSPAAQEAPTHK